MLQSPICLQLVPAGLLSTQSRPDGTPVMGPPTPTAAEQHPIATYHAEQRSSVALALLRTLPYRNVSNGSRSQIRSSVTDRPTALALWMRPQGKKGNTRKPDRVGRAQKLRCSAARGPCPPAGCAAEGTPNPWPGCQHCSRSATNADAPGVTATCTYECKASEEYIAACPDAGRC